MALLRQSSSGLSSQGLGKANFFNSNGRKYVGHRKKLRGLSNLVHWALVCLILTVVTFFLLISFSSFPFSDRGDLQISQNNEFDNQDHPSHFSFWNSRRHHGNSRANLEKQDIGVKDKTLQNADNTANQERAKVLKFGRGSAGFGRDSRYWDKDDRRRDEDYVEEDTSFSESETSISNNKNIKNARNALNGRTKEMQFITHKDTKVEGLYNEGGRDELKLYEKKYEASLEKEQSEDDAHEDEQNDVEDDYDDGIDEDDMHEENEPFVSESNPEKRIKNSSDFDIEELPVKDASHRETLDVTKHDEGKKAFSDNKGAKESSLLLHGFHQDSEKGVLVSNLDQEDSSKRSRKDRRKASFLRKVKRRKHTGVACEPKFLNSTSDLVDPAANPKFANFSLQYVEKEEIGTKFVQGELRFAGHQTLQEREASFVAHDQKLHCGFVKAPNGSSIGFDISKEDADFLNTCHIAVSSCIFGNSDNLRTPPGKKVTRSSKKNVCFAMFVDESTLKTMISEGREPDDKGYIGLWKIVVVRNLPYTDMRRTGKVPKFLTHRLFPSARYSIWLDSKLRLQSDPLLILEYFLWRRGAEYAISNHYDRHCVWEEVEQNKRLNKFNHTVIDEQFKFYQNDGLRRFNASDPNKLLPSHVPEGSFIVRAHTPMSNLFSCLWFNEVDRFTPRDQLSFAYTYLKLHRMNPEKHFYFHMFKDCERRRIAKLYRHKTVTAAGVSLQSTV